MSRLVAINKAARDLQISPSYLRRLVRRGKLPDGALRDGKIDYDVISAVVARERAAGGTTLHAAKASYAGLSAPPSEARDDDDDARLELADAPPQPIAPRHDDGELDLETARARRMAALARLAEIEVERRRAGYVPVGQIRIACDRIRAEIVDEYQIWVNWLPTFLQSEGVPQDVAIKIQRYAIETLMRQFAQRLQRIADQYADRG